MLIFRLGLTHPNLNLHTTSMQAPSFGRWRAGGNFLATKKSVTVYSEVGPPETSERYQKMVVVYVRDLTTNVQAKDGPEQSTIPWVAMIFFISLGSKDVMVK